MRWLAAAGAGLFTRTDPTAVAQRGAAAALVIRVANAGLAYVAQVVLARLMGQFEYGVFAYCWVWFVVIGAVGTLGFGESPVRFIPQIRERGEMAHLRGFVRFAPIVIMVTSVAAGALLIAGLLVAEPWIGNAYVMPMMLVGLALPFLCLQSFLEGIGRSYGWTIPALVPTYILRHGLLLLFMLAAVAIGFEANAVNGFICVVLTLAVSLLYQAFDILRRLGRVLDAGPRAYSAREWVAGSLPFAVYYGALHISSFADVFVLSFFVSPAEIAIYFAATRIIQVVNLVPYAATVGSAHLISAAHARGDQETLQRLCRHVCAMTFLIATATVVMLVASGEWLLGMFGQGFEAGYTPLAILAVGLMARVAAGPGEDILNMTGHSSLSASTYVVIVIISIALNVALVIPYGLNGAAVATACALAVRAVWLSVAVRRRLGINTWVFAALPSWRGIRSATGLQRSELSTPAE